jgi:NAD(P)-dependent dehydrogenase (short-subunit alcohol dehydrogenase family)
VTESVVIVTGGAGGIGAGIVACLTEAGHQIVVADLPVTDVSDAGAVGSLVEQTVAEFGRIDGLVNNAAIGPLGTVLDTDEATFDRIFAVNVKGAFLMSQAVLPHLISAGGGAIVNVGSGAGHGKPNMAAYAASKSALHTLGASMAYDHFHQHVRVNTVIPGGGGIPTGISLDRFGGSAADYAALPHVGSVVGRPVTPNDVGNVVAFLCSAAAEAISGTVIDVGAMANQGGPLAASVPGRAPMGSA